MSEEHYERPQQCIIDEARALLRAAEYCADYDLCEKMTERASMLLAPFVERKIPEALFLNISKPYDTTRRKYTNEELDLLFISLLREAAEAGSIEAKFRLACELDEDKTREEASKLFQEAAEAGHAYAMWCHGLNLYGGSGLSKNEEKGIEFIRKSAELKFEGAINFVASAYAAGVYGFPKDEVESAKWWKKLADKDLISY